MQSVEHLCSILPDFNWQCARVVPQRQLGFLFKMLWLLVSMVWLMCLIFAYLYLLIYQQFSVTYVIFYYQWKQKKRWLWTWHWSTLGLTIDATIWDLVPVCACDRHRKDTVNTCCERNIHLHDSSEHFMKTVSAIWCINSYFVINTNS